MQKQGRDHVCTNLPQPHPYIKGVAKCYMLSTMNPTLFLKVLGTCSVIPTSHYYNLQTPHNTKYTGSITKTLSFSDQRGIHVHRAIKNGTYNYDGGDCSSNLLLSLLKERYTELEVSDIYPDSSEKKMYYSL